MKERLLKFLEEESLTAAKFADEIGVQRSSISHILSGRNNPGFDFFQKILKRYPHLNAEWLLMGSGKMSKTHEQASLFTVDSAAKAEPNNQSLLNDKIEPNIPGSEKFNVPKNDGLKLSQETNGNTSVVSIERIVILYTNKSFREYVPSK